MYRIQLRAKPKSDSTHKIILMVYGYSRLNPKKRIKREHELKLPPCEKKFWNNEDQRYRRHFPNYMNLNRKVVVVEEHAKKCYYNASKKGVTVYAEDFLEEFLKHKEETNTSNNKVMVWAERLIEHEKKGGSFKNAKVHQGSLDIFRHFLEHEGIEDMDLDTLPIEIPTLFQQYLTNVRGNKGGTVRIRMACLHRWWTFYHDMSEKDITRNPFKLVDKKTLKSDHTDRPTLTREQWLEIKGYTFTKRYQRSINFFRFSLMFGGMNFIDMMKLTYSKNLQNGILRFYRSKIEGSVDLLVEIPITDDMQSLLDWFKVDGDDRMIPYVNYPRKSEQWRTSVDNLRDKTNKRLTEVQEKLGYDLNLRMYTARYSFATILYFEGVPISIIARLMGHTSELMTINYLKKLNVYDMQEQIKDEINRVL